MGEPSVWSIGSAPVIRVLGRALRTNVETEENRRGLLRGPGLEGSGGGTEGKGGGVLGKSAAFHRPR